MSYNTIHETAVQDVIDVMKDGITTFDGKLNPSGAAKSLSRASSLSKATSGLTLIFPTLVDSSIPIETASIITKAVERKAVSLLQIAFSAYNISNTKDAVEYIRSFHTNIKGKMTMDDFIDVMDSFSEQVQIPREDRRKYDAVMEDLKHLCNYHLGEDISESSVNDYKVAIRGITPVVVKEDRNSPFTGKGAKINPMDIDMSAPDTTGIHYSDDERKDIDTNLKLRKDQRDTDKYNDEKEQHRKDNEFRQRQYDDDMNQRRRDNARNDKTDSRLDTRNDVQNAKDSIEMIQKQLLPTDVKKANEMIPSMLVVNFITLDKDTQSQISRQVVIGVKAKMIAVDPTDVANKIVTKHTDSNVLLKFIKASTREISFAKDFLFAIDNAKLNAIANSKKGSNTYRILKVLERRALKGKVRKALKVNNAYKAISTLVISSETAEGLMRYNNIDVMNAGVIRKLMEDLNLMMFIVADETEESVSIIMDTGDDNYETLSYTHLDREAADGSYKKAINLMAKVTR